MEKTRLLALSWLFGWGVAQALADPAAVEIAPDGAWTWFNDERAIWHDGVLFTGYMMREGDAGVTRYDPETGKATHSVFGTAASREKDDHNNPSLTALPDGRLLAIYSKHNTARSFFQRHSKIASPAEIEDWGPEVEVETPAGNTYANTFLLGERLFNFHRSINFNPTLSLSTDFGESWGEATHFIKVGGGETRPYPRFTSNQKDRIDLIYTDGHPRNHDNSVYHLYFKEDAFRKSDGGVLRGLADLPILHGKVSDPADGEKGSVIYQFDPKLGRGWTWDIELDGDSPVCVYQTQRDEVTGKGWENDRIYYYYARWDGSDWKSTFIAQAGRGLYESEDDYGGGMAIDPEDPRVVYISTNAARPFDLDDRDDVPLAENGRYEIWRGVTEDGGASFKWEAVTSGSKEDNLRPIVPKGHGRETHLLWFAGKYRSYLDYECRVMGVFGD